MHPDVARVHLVVTDEEGAHLVLNAGKGAALQPLGECRFVVPGGDRVAAVLVVHVAYEQARSQAARPVTLDQQALVRLLVLIPGSGPDVPAADANDHDAPLLLPRPGRGGGRRCSIGLACEPVNGDGQRSGVT